MPTEANTCRKFVVPKLQAAGWENGPHSMIQQAAKPDADPFDLLCHLAFNTPLLTRRQRADRVKKKQAAFFSYFAPEAREILSKLLEKYAADGELQLTLPDVLKVPPISHRGNVNEIMGKFGGPDNLRNSVNELQSLLYAV
jgi:type I restriction enzyme R subunit